MRIDDIGYHHKHGADFTHERPHGVGDWLLLLIKTPAIFYLNGVAQTVSAHSLMIFSRDVPIHYTAAAGEYIDDWIHFEPEQTEIQHLQALHIPCNQICPLSDVTGLSAIVKHMCYEFYSAHPYRVDIAQRYFEILIYKIGECILQQYPDVVLHETPYVSELLWIRESIYRWPAEKWSIDEFASKLNISRSRFQHLYHETFGMSVKQDMISSRIRRACQLLVETNQSVSSIADACGYSLPYFTTLFQTATGTSPSMYRTLRQTDDASKSE